MNSLVVQKFGGSSVGSPEKICAVADRLAEDVKRGMRLVVVVSAMGDTTDELIALAEKVSHACPHREMDMLLSVGERISMALLSMALADRGIQAVSLTGSQSGIVTDRRHRRASIRWIKPGRVVEVLNQGKVAIVAGFQGVSETKEITTLGRGGSDTTAVALAAALKADICRIFTDVAGVYSADPRIVPDARHYAVLPFDRMLEFASFGAGVLHPRCVALAQKYGVPMSVEASTSFEGGTQLMDRALMKAADLEACSVMGVAADRSRFFLTIEGDMLAHAGELSVLAPTMEQGHTAFFAERESLADWNALLTRLQQEGGVKKWECALDLAPVTLVGDRIDASEIFKMFAEKQIVAFHGSVTTMTLAVPLEAIDETVRLLHSTFVGHA